jgi:hypothetical protein
MVGLKYNRGEVFDLLVEHLNLDYCSELKDSKQRALAVMAKIVRVGSERGAGVVEVLDV